ncbi:MAG: glucose-6-phosphate dehydrogenase, partial [Solirubrobacterales bacterium]
MAGGAATAAAIGTAPTQALDDHVIVLFGATGDLAQRKLLPGMFHLAEAGLMPERFRILGTSLGELADDEFRALARSAVDEFGEKPRTAGSWESFAARLSFTGMSAGLGALGAAVEEAQKEVGPRPRLLHYLSVPPAASASIIEELGRLGLNDRARVIMEKPFGTDLASA